MTSEIYIQENLKRKILAFLINLFLVFGVFFIPDNNVLPDMPDWYNKLDLYLSIIFGIPLIWQTYMLFQKSGIKLSPQGIEENLSRMKTRKFLWTEIRGIRYMQMFFLKFLVIYTRDKKPIKVPIHNMDKTPQEIFQIITNYCEMLFPPAPVPTEEKEGAQ